MSKTIEERAKEYSRGFLAIVSSCAEKSYIEGAIEQKQIDIDKACDVHCKFACNRYNNQKERYKDCWHRLHGQCCLLNDFRKALED